MNTDSVEWTRERFVVVDVEGNGCEPPEIVECAIAEIVCGQIAGPVREWLVKPRNRITNLVERIHGISNPMVANAPSFSEIAADIRSMLRTDYLVAHNASVELRFLTSALAGWQPRGVVDTLRLARRFLPGRRSYSLTALTDELGLAPPRDKKGRPHRAGFDAMAAARLFVFLAVAETGAPRRLSDLLQEESGSTGEDWRQGSLF